MRLHLMAVERPSARRWRSSFGTIHHKVLHVGKPQIYESMPSHHTLAIALAVVLSSAQNTGDFELSFVKYYRRREKHEVNIPCASELERRRYGRLRLCSREQPTKGDENAAQY